MAVSVGILIVVVSIFCGVEDVPVVAVTCNEGIDNVLLGITLLDDDETKLLLLRLPLKLCKLLCVNWDGPKAGLGDSAPDESSDSAPDESPERSSWQKEKQGKNIYYY